MRPIQVLLLKRIALLFKLNEGCQEEEEQENLVTSFYKCLYGRTQTERGISCMTLPGVSKRVVFTQNEYKVH